MNSAETSTIRAGHKAADAMDWDEAMRVIDRMAADGHHRDALLVASGCYLGLRVSDLLQLRWMDLLTDELVLKEQKTGKTRTLRVAASLQKFAASCRRALGGPSADSFVFVPEGKGNPVTRQAVDKMLKHAKLKYHIRSAKVFSSHSLRKTFGRRVWLQECEKGRGDQALLLLADVFGHSSVAITKRYLGIRQEEILSVYDSLDG
ncbi:MAG: tyrosine-type recombinase/integrase [Bacteroidales bacterium]|nr:tyrosine-type recombinase/integrase [Bacteroidales bacterium]